MIGASLALVIALNGAVVPVSEGDIPWFVERPAARAEVLRRCHADHALAATRECRNAESAGAATLGRPFPKEGLDMPWLKQAPQPVPQVTKERDRGS
jgi:hypothetical protein